MKRLFTILIISLLYQLVQAADPVLNYGLRFQSSSVPFEKTTSLLLNNGIAYNVQNNLTLQFSLEIHKERNIYPYGNIFCLNYDGRSFLSFRLLQDRIFSIIYAGKIYSFDTDIELETWKPLSVSFDFDKGYVDFSCGDKKSQIKVPFKKHPEIVVMFGDNTPENNTQKDVPTMVVKDVKVYTDGNLVNYWKLDRYDRNVSYDELSSTKAAVKNPIWEIDSHTKWKKVFSVVSDNFLDATYNPSNSSFYILQKDSVLQYYCVNDSLVRIPINSTLLSKLMPRGDLSFNPTQGSLLFYGLDDKVISNYSQKENRWSNLPNELSKKSFNHHSSVYNPKDSSIYVFGGYGFYKYRNNLHRLNLNTSNITEIDYFPKLMPRRNSAMTIVGDDLYVFGGRGNKQGRQEFHVDNCWELQRINLKTKQSECLWKLNEVKYGMSLNMAPQMYYEPFDSSFTAVSINGDSVRVWRIMKNDSIVKNLFAHRVQNPGAPTSGLVFCKSLQEDKFYLLVKETVSLDKTQIAVYSINSPILDKVSIVSKVSRNTGEKESIGSYTDQIIFVVLVLILGLLAFYLFRKNKKKQKISLVEDVPVNEQLVVKVSTIEKEIEDEPSELPEVKYFDRKHSSISLLGGFNVFDKEGVDITSLFTPRLKSLLLLIILHTEKNPKGIFVNSVTESLWPEKEVESARNNLNVSLRKLRLLLDKVGDLKISNNSGFISIHWSNDVFCDYREALNSIRLSNNVPSDNDLFNKILELMLYGPLLPNTVFDWLDNFKEAYSSMAIDFLRESLDLQKGHNAILLKITHIMFLHDTLSEDALRVQCTVLINQGKKGLAMKAYNHFCKEYKDLLGIDYKKSIQDLYMD